MTTRFFDRVDRLDELIAAGPHGCDFERDVAPLLLESASAEYFFSHIDEPAWIHTLMAGGAFESPPKAMDHEDGRVAFPRWPPASFLTRIAPEVPEEVFRILTRIPDSDNVRVHGQLVEAILHLPSGYAARMVDRLHRWLGVPHRKMYGKEIARLIQRLAGDGEPGAALALARGALTVLPLGDPDPDESRNPIEWTAPVRTRFDSWNYRNILESTLPDLTSGCGLGALVLVSDLLYDSVVFTSHERPGIRDYSDIWAPRIQVGGDRQESIRTALVLATRDVAAELIEGEADLARPVVEILEGKCLQVFNRLVLDLLRQFPEARGLVQERLLRRRYFDGFGSYPEYVELLRRRFGSLSGRDQEMIFDWISQGPDVKVFEANWTTLHGEPPSIGELESFRLHWERDILAVIQDDLPSRWTTRFQDLVSRLGDPEEVVPRMRTSSWVGPTSPKSVEELMELKPQELLAFLQEWEEEATLDSPSKEGLGRNLAGVVCARPDRVVPIAEEFPKLDPVYTGHVIQGLSQAVDEGNGFEWTPVLRLCQSVMREEAAARGDDPNGRSEWLDAAQAIPRLLQKGMNSGKLMIPTDLKGLVWPAIQGLSRHPEPSPEHEGGYGGANMDPYTLAINTVRGKALDAAVSYGLWLHRELPDDGGRRTFRDGMPELESLLDRHLDPVVDPSIAVRGVYGRWLPWLLLMDAEWTTDRVDQIFPRGGTDQETRLWWAAWSAYISYSPPYDAVLPVIREQYRRAVAAVADDLTLIPSGSARLQERLAEHLMVYFWRGALELGSEELISQFLGSAPGELRAHAIRFIGRSLGNTEHSVPPEVLHRLRELWEIRLSSYRESVEPADRAIELGAFATWFESRKFPAEWSLRQFHQTIEMGADLDHHSFMLLEVVAEMADTMPTESVGLLEHVIDPDQDPWMTSTGADAIKTILRNALAGDDPQGRSIAVEVIDRLGRAGHLSYRALLKE